jgi:hypothetical protein
MRPPIQILSIALLCLCELASGQSDEGKLGGFKAGIELREQAGQRDLGLPLYPAAKVQRDDASDKGAVSLGLWGGAFGVRLAVAKFSSEDDIDAVARYYRVTMAAYGTVLECREANSGRKSAKPEADKLSCEDAEPGVGGLVLKVGKPKDQRVVSLQPKGKQVHFQLVRIEAKGD